LHLLEAGEYSLDANVVVDFYKADHLPLLSRLLPRRLLMSDLVAAELAEANIYYPDPAVITFESDEAWELLGEIRSSMSSLGIGEIAALVVAKLNGVGMLTNDWHARMKAGALGIGAVGSLGLLEDAVDLGYLSPASACTTLDRIVTAGAWISNDLLAAFRDQMNRRNV
jgi:predicted nucleic acid-binding protein